MECIIYIHGKGGHPDEARYFRRLYDGCEIIGLDYRGTTPYDTKPEIIAEYESLSRKFGRVSVIAVSIGAYFCMNALKGKDVARAFFISPVVNMEKLIAGMMAYAGVSEAELEAKKEVDTEFGEKLSWECLRYVRDNPIEWTAPTWILHGEKDNLIPVGRVREFAQKHNAELTVMPGGDHWFHTDEQTAFLDEWFKRCISKEE
ncbi:MAG: alpha/beta hydrolase [Synergistaceae bacterium]|nr:alpha/beta hydrolase [Synergistaceae bacterium]